VEVHARSAFLQGLLLMSRTALPAHFAPWSQLWERWHQWLWEHEVSAVQACLAFPLSFPEISRVVVGAENASQLGHILEAADGARPAELPDLRCDAEDLIDPTRWAPS
jgi:aryl-alcohol dehydrogenase-like predicted oxidoreductase